MLVCIGLIPGFPKIQIFGLAAFVALVGWSLVARAKIAAAKAAKSEDPLAAAAPSEGTAPRPKRKDGDDFSMVTPLTVDIDADIRGALSYEALNDQIMSVRRALYHDLGSNVLILGVTFKENCPDCRNTKVVDIANELEEFGCNVDIYDPWASSAVVKHEYGKDLIPAVDPDKRYSAVIACVSHDQFKNFDFQKYRDQGAVIFDVKNFVDRSLVDARL